MKRFLTYTLIAFTPMFLLTLLGSNESLYWCLGISLGIGMGSSALGLVLADLNKNEEDEQ